VYYQVVIETSEKMDKKGNYREYYEPDKTDLNETTDDTAIPLLKKEESQSDGYLTNPSDIRRYIAYVPQDVHLFKGTIKENIIASEHHPDDNVILHASKVSTTDEFVSMHPLGYDMPIGERGAGLSGGQRQSVAIARSLVQDSSIMLMDEPSNAMDQTTENKLISNLKDRFENETLILVTQKMSLLSIVDRVVVMHHGKIALNDKKDVVIKKLGGSFNE